MTNPTIPLPVQDTVSLEFRSVFPTAWNVNAPMILANYLRVVEDSFVPYGPDGKLVANWENLDPSLRKPLLDAIREREGDARIEDLRTAPAPSMGGRPRFLAFTAQRAYYPSWEEGHVVIASFGPGALPWAPPAVLPRLRWRVDCATGAVRTRCVHTADLPCGNGNVRLVVIRSDRDDDKGWYVSATGIGTDSPLVSNFSKPVHPANDQPAALQIAAEAVVLASLREHAALVGELVQRLEGTL